MNHDELRVSARRRGCSGCMPLYSLIASSARAWRGSGSGTAEVTVPTSSRDRHRNQRHAVPGDHRGARSDKVLRHRTSPSHIENQTASATRLIERAPMGDKKTSSVGSDGGERSCAPLQATRYRNSSEVYSACPPTTAALLRRCGTLGQSQRSHEQPALTSPTLRNPYGLRAARLVKHRAQVQPSADDIRRIAGEETPHRRQRDRRAYTGGRFIPARLLRTGQEILDETGHPVYRGRGTAAGWAHGSHFVIEVFDVEPNSVVMVMARQRPRDRRGADAEVMESVFRTSTLRPFSKFRPTGALANLNYISTTTSRATPTRSVVTEGPLEDGRGSPAGEVRG